MRVRVFACSNLAQPFIRCRQNTLLLWKPSSTSSLMQVKEGQARIAAKSAFSKLPAMLSKCPWFGAKWKPQIASSPSPGVPLAMQL